MEAFILSERTARFERAKAVFANTIWGVAFHEIQHPEWVVAINFDDDGKILVVRSPRHNNDAYHVATLLTHLDILKRRPVRLGEAVPLRAA